MRILWGVLTWLQLSLGGLALLIGVVALVYVVLDRAIDTALLGLVGLLAIGALIQLVVGVTLLVGTDREVAAASFVGYLVGLVAVPPLAAFWALGERSRAGTAVLIVLGLLVPVLLLRLDQIWTASVA